MKIHTLVLTLLLTGLSPALQAQQEPSLDEVLQGFEANDTATDLDAVMEGFDDAGKDGASELDQVLTGFDDEPASASTGRKSPQQGNWTLGGALTLSASYNYAHQAPPAGQTDHRGLSRLRAKLNLELDGKLNAQWKAHATGYGYYDAAYQLNGRSDYSAELLDENESEVELGEAYLQGKLHAQSDLKFGRQIVVWGKSDNLRVTDVLNPMDNREPGLVDIEDLRLPLAMARLDYYVQDWEFTALAIPEIRFHKLPAEGSDFYPLSMPYPTESMPDDGGSNTEYALAANGIFSGWDLSLYWAQVFDDNPYLLMTPTGPELRHARLTMNGAAANLALGNWLLKTELARLKHLRYSAAPNSDKHRSDLLLGVEYSGFHDTTVSLEVVDRHLHEYDATLAAAGVEQDQWQTALRYSGDFLHARLTLQALFSRLGKALDDGGFTRFSTEYELRDALNLTGGIIQYHRGNTPPFNVAGDSDRLFLDIKYSF